MQLGSVYLICKDFAKTIEFYTMLLEEAPCARNRDRFAEFCKGGQAFCVMNGYYDVQHPGETVFIGSRDAIYDDLPGIARAENGRKAVLNFWTEDLAAEYARVKPQLPAEACLTPIRYLCSASPYYYFSLLDPDGNIVEVTGNCTDEAMRQTWNSDEEGDA